MQYLEEATIQGLICLLFNSTGKFKLSRIEYESRMSLLGMIYDNRLGDCFNFTLNENEMKKTIGTDDFDQAMEMFKRTDDTFVPFFKIIAKSNRLI